MLLTWWTWVWVNSGSWWWTGRPGMLRFMGSQRVGHDWATDLIWSLNAAADLTGGRAQKVIESSCKYRWSFARLPLLTSFCAAQFLTGVDGGDPLDVMSPNLMTSCVMSNFTITVRISSNGPRTQFCYWTGNAVVQLLPYSEGITWYCDLKQNHLFLVLVLKGLVDLHRTVQLQLLQCYWLGHRLGLLWYWMVCLGNEQRSSCRFWDCIQVLHFGLFCWPLGRLLDPPKGIHQSFEGRLNF